MFKVEHPDNLCKPWRGTSLTLNDKAGFNEYIVSSLGKPEKRMENIKKFLQQDDVKHMLGDDMIQQILKKDPKQVMQNKATAIDFANSG